MLNSQEQIPKQRSALDPAKLIFRDAVEDDLPRCLTLDTSFHSDYVWQMNVNDGGDEIHVNCRRQRLPRQLIARHPVDERRLRSALRMDHCFAVVEDPSSRQIVGYVTMRLGLSGRVFYLQDLVVDLPHRRRSLGARLVHVARVWASEFRLQQIIFEIPTTNYPAIRFAQAQGFTFCGFNDHHFANREIALFFSLSI
ncbi:MAG: GNAT family N-acetyltransferase [Chloroflexi bacterium]|nr:GNAT family N-acetyltransferase [Chloroflexota bacterium]MCY4247713.1 GNAT family N-acetyltransferase [Chloroflexota bacterium]